MQTYSRIAMFLHWTIAAAIAFQISVGFALEALGSRGFAVYQIHKSIGITILVLSVIRLAVRYWKPRPAAVEAGWEGALAKMVHLGLYVFMIGAPLTGWALVSTAKVKVPTLLFGTIPLPHLPLPHTLHEVAEKGHGFLAFLGVALFLLHIAGAIRHHLLLRDGLAWRMVPGRSVAVMGVLLALVPAALVLGKVVAQPGANATPVVAAAPEPVESNVTVAAAEEPAVENLAMADNATETKPLAGPSPVWTVQPGGKIGFSVGNDGDKISGGFSRWTAKIVMDPDHPETADIRVEIDLASGSVGDPTQNEMLPNDEFLGVAAHPRATFVAKGATASGPNSYSAKGTLTLKGASAPQSIRFTLAGAGLKRRVTGSATIARKAFGVGNGDSSNGLDPSVALSFNFAATGKAP